LRRYEIVIDGAVVGRLASGESSAFEVVAGSHEVYVKVIRVAS
jgi:hypothetical protein